ncbi:LOW QUALITY PROTEIN: uncharacterized protein LOC129230137 [Uloborus diversus]|uniref:LOW QUALITY PROTEIN: uncharacterized protein LOC129230137 n=1 Tax=Uloborus diversus TaxID=327109 RepID=UPI0024092F38|nr:LOW QUALITY PROTEIN: uncharacterized protein LOC129230137 [Uloborus diversus]
MGQAIARFLSKGTASAAVDNADESSRFITCAVIPEPPKTASTITTEAQTAVSATPLPSTAFEKALDDDDLLFVSWHLLPEEATQNLERGEKLRAVDFRFMVRVIVDDILKKNSTPSKNFVAKVAEQCVKKYPLLKDKFNAVTLGTGYDNLAYRFYTRVENVRRKPNSCQDSSPIKKRRVQIDSYGCTAFEPPLPQDISVDELLTKKGILQHLSISDEADRAIELMKETYYQQRMAINKNAVMEELMVNWPIMFTERGIEAHFHLLSDIKLTDVLRNSVLSKGRSLLSFFRSQSRKEVKAFMAESDMNICSPNELLLLVLGLAKHFDELTEAVFFIDEIFNPHIPHLHLLKHRCLFGKGNFGTSGPGFPLL